MIKYSLIHVLCFWQTCCGFLHILHTGRRCSDALPGCNANVALNADKDQDLLVADNALHTAAIKTICHQTHSITFLSGKLNWLRRRS